MEPDPLQLDSKLRGRVILGLQRAIAATFSASEWIELGYVIGQHDYISRHERLLRSLRFGDDDYGACIFQFLNHLYRNDTSALYRVAEHAKIKEHLEANAPDLLADLGLSDGHIPIDLPSAPSAADVVRRALADAENLLNSSGATSAIDRLHTALHGYLRSACKAANIAGSDNASITALFKLLRTQHPELKDLGSQEPEIARIITAFATVVDALNTIRNHASIAHPNEKLLAETEASLTVNAVRTLFNYLVRKLG